MIGKPQSRSVTALLREVFLAGGSCRYTSFRDILTQHERSPLLGLPLQTSRNLQKRPCFSLFVYNGKRSVCNRKHASGGFEC